MGSRVTATTLDEIAVLLELRGEDARARPFHAAARAPEKTPADPEVAEVLREVELTGGAILLDELREETPEGLFEMLRLPGLVEGLPLG